MAFDFGVAILTQEPVIDGIYHFLINALLMVSVAVVLTPLVSIALGNRVALQREGNMPRGEGSGQMAVVLCDAHSVVLHFENFIDRHLALAPGLLGGRDPPRGDGETRDIRSTPGRYPFSPLHYRPI